MKGQKTILRSVIWKINMIIYKNFGDPKWKIEEKFQLYVVWLWLSIDL